MILDHDLIGDGPVRVLAVHDWTSTRSTWGACRSGLDTAQFSYCLVDLRGYGGSRNLEGRYDAAEVVGDLLDTATSLDWPQFHLVGHSMSAVPCQLAAATSGERVQSLALVTPVPAEGVPVDPDGLAMFRSSATDDEAFCSIAKMLTSGRLPEAWYAKKLGHQRASIDPEAFLGYLSMWTRTGEPPTAPRLDTPALVVVGRHDYEFFRRDNLEPLIQATLPKATFAVVDDAGHFPMSETPLLFAQLIQDFFASQA